MAPMADNSTVVIRTKYRAAGHEHVVKMRYARGTPLEDARSNAHTCLAAIVEAFEAAGNLFDDFTWLTSDGREEDSEDWEPFTFLPVPSVGTVDPATVSPIRRVISTTFPCRGPGRLGRVVLYGFNWGIDDDEAIAGDGVVLGTELAAVGTAVTALNTAALVVINNAAATFYNKATIKVNDYWLRQVRRGF